MKFDRLADELGATTPRRRKAIRLVVDAWNADKTLAFGSRDRAAMALKASATAAYAAERKATEATDGPKGFVVGLTIGWIAMVAMASALSWAISSFLNWWWHNRDRRLEIEWDDE